MTERVKVHPAMFAAAGAVDARIDEFEAAVRRHVNLHTDNDLADAKMALRNAFLSLLNEIAEPGQ